jgi:cob(I)alamin adenosyltransferase
MLALTPGCDRTSDAAGAGPVPRLDWRFPGAEPRIAGMRIYTRTGDRGETGLIGNRRVRKDDPRVEAYGAVDELNSWLGLLRAEPLPAPLDRRLGELQDLLFELGTDLATPGGQASVPRLTAAAAGFEQWMDAMDADLPVLRSFVLPGGHRESALCHLARTSCRRAERRFWALAAREAVPEAGGMFLNRLSDLLFVLARHSNARHGRPDVPWPHAGPPTG